MLGKFLSINKQWEKYELEYCRLADNIIVVVDEANQRLARLGIDERKITVVSNTLNLAHFEVPETKPDADYITLLYAGGINKHRGLQTVIKGLKLTGNLPKPVRLWILGTGSYVDELKSLATAEDVKDNVFFEGWKNYREMQTYFGKSDYCLIPHVKNDHTDSTIPHKIFQYMYAGKPMLVSDCAPLKRIVEETKSGLVYAFDKPEDFANKLHELVNNKDFHSSTFVRSNRKQVTEKYNWRIDSSHLNALYQ
jgi:glycosyltransferase involved in cell wall biosynthesis